MTLALHLSLWCHFHEFGSGTGHVYGKRRARSPIVNGCGGLALSSRGKGTRHGRSQVDSTIGYDLFAYPGDVIGATRDGRLFRPGAGAVYA
jgi:hypothetical protein